MQLHRGLDVWHAVLLQVQACCLACSFKLQQRAHAVCPIQVILSAPPHLPPSNPSSLSLLPCPAPAALPPLVHDSIPTFDYPPSMRTGMLLVSLAAIALFLCYIAFLVYITGRIMALFPAPLRVGLRSWKGMVLG